MACPNGFEPIDSCCCFGEPLTVYNPGSCAEQVQNQFPLAPCYQVGDHDYCREIGGGASFCSCQQRPSTMCGISNATNQPVTIFSGLGCISNVDGYDSCRCDQINTVNTHCQIIPWDVLQTLPPGIGCGVCRPDEGCCLNGISATITEPGACEHFGGTWNAGQCSISVGCKNINPYVCSYMGGTPLGRLCEPDEPACRIGGCCLCNRCCDIEPQACTNRGGVVLSASCDDAGVQATCKNLNIRPPCKQGKWQIAMRPTEHTSGMTNPITPHVVEICSAAPQRTNDLDPNAPSPEECRYNYGWLQRSGFRAMEGRICNTYNRNCVTTTPGSKKKSPRLNLVRSANSNTMEFIGRYRIPCPEAADFGCTTQVGCAA